MLPEIRRTCLHAGNTNDDFMVNKLERSSVVLPEEIELKKGVVGSFPGVARSCDFIALQLLPFPR